MKKAKLFICHHPDSLLLYKNLVEVIRKYDKDSKIVLFKVNHPYFLRFNFAPYKQYFDEIIEFNFINYKKNFLLGYWETLKFQRKLKKTEETLLASFKTIDLFLGNSAWLPINILLYNLSRNKNIKNITRVGLGSLECSQTKKDNPKTLLCALYSLPFKCYKVKVISTLAGKFQDFVYDSNVPGKLINIVSPLGQDFKKKDALPYPVIYDNFIRAKKDMVIIFGSASIFGDYSEYLLKYEILVEKMKALFKTLEKKYPDCRLYYKPHPADKDRLMPGINPTKYTLFDNTVNAQIIIDRYCSEIKATYSFSSSSVVFSSFFGIPSYTFYRYLCNQAGVEEFDSVVEQDNVKSEFLFHIADLSEIGKIDNLKCPIIDSKNLEAVYRKVLNV